MISNQFLIILSISELVYYPNEDEDIFIADPLLNQIINLIDVNIQIEKIYERYHESPRNTGDVLIFRSNSLNNAYILVDSFKEGTDQLDLVIFGVCVEDKVVVGQLKILMRKLFDKSQFQIIYKEGQSVLSSDYKSENYPKKIYGTNGKVFMQQFKVY